VSLWDTQEVTVVCTGQLGVGSQKVEDPEVYGTADLLVQRDEVIALTGRWICSSAP
jgi:hypothetical protein